MVEVEEGREFRFRGDLYSHESTFPVVPDILARIDCAQCTDAGYCYRHSSVVCLSVCQSRPCVSCKNAPEPG